MFGLFIAGLLAAAEPLSPVAEAGSLILADEVLRVGDISTGAPNPDLVIARLPAHLSYVQLSEGDRHALLRARMPGMRFALKQHGTLNIRRSERRVAARRQGGTCYALRTELPAGAYITRQDAVETECRYRPVDRGLRYDREAEAPMAGATIPAGAYLGRLRLPVDRPIGAGTKLTLRTRLGPVTVERSVTSLQSGRAGKHLFVQTEEGEILASQLAILPEANQ